MNIPPSRAQTAQKYTGFSKFMAMFHSWGERKRLGALRSFFALEEAEKGDQINNLKQCLQCTDTHLQAYLDGIPPVAFRVRLDRAKEEADLQEKTDRIAAKKAATDQTLNDREKVQTNAKPFFRTKCLEHFMTAADVAERADMSRHGVAKIFKGNTKRTPPTTLKKLCAVFNAKIEDIIDFNPEDGLEIDDDIISNFLIAYRKTRKLNQYEAADRAGIPRQTYWRIETQQSGCQMKNLKRICEGLEVTPRQISDFGKQRAKIKCAAERRKQL